MPDLSARRRPPAPTSLAYRLAAIAFLALLAAWLLVGSASCQTGPVVQGTRQIALADVNAALDEITEARNQLPAGAAAVGQLDGVITTLEKAKATAEDPTVAVAKAQDPNPAAGPYFQLVTGESVLLRWVSTDSAAATVQYGLKGQIAATATAKASAVKTAGEEGTIYEAQLMGLKPGTAYSYTVPIGGRNIAGTFKTAPAADQPFSFVVWGDSQGATHTLSTLAELMAKKKPDLAVCVGDLVRAGTGDAAYCRDFFQPAAELLRDAPLFVAIGNHEYFMDKDLSLFRKFMRLPNDNKGYYAFTYGNSRFVMLNTDDSTLYRGAQLEWFKKELDSAAFKQAEFHFVFTHRPPFSSDMYGNDSSIQAAVVPLVESHPVDIFFSGHVHSYQRGLKRIDGRDMYYVVTGGGGAPLHSPGIKIGKEPGDFITKRVTRHHFTHLSVEGQRLTLTAIDEDGKTLDEFAIDHSGKPSATRPSTQPAGGAKARTGGARAGDETRMCAVSEADLTTAIAALETVASALRDDQKKAAATLRHAAMILERGQR